MADDLLNTKHPEFSIGGVAPKREDESSAWWYRNLKLPIAFTSGLLVGRDFQSETWFYLGFHPAGWYAHVRELIFEEGTLKSEVDASDAINAIRLKLLSERKPSQEKDRGQIDSSIGRHFTYDYVGRGPGP